MSRWQKSLLFITLLFISGLLAAAIILPDIIRTKAIEQLRKDYNRTLTIDKIILHPFSLEVEIHNFDLKEVDSQRSFVSFDRLKFSLSLRSLIDHALIINDLSLDRPFILLEKTAINRFNFSDFIPSSKPASTASAGMSSPFHFSLNNLQISDGNLVFFDSSNKLGQVHHIDELNLSIPFIGNIPYLVKLYIQPALSLRIDGALLAAHGQMKPFDKSIETQLKLNLDRVNLPFYASYLQPFLPFELTDGSLSAQVDIAYRVSSAQKPKLKIGGNLSLRTLRLEQQGEPLFFLPLLLVDLDWADPLTDEYHLSSLSVYGPQLTIRRGADGDLNLQKLMPEPSSSPRPEETTKPGALPHLSIATVRLREGVIEFTDAVPTEGFSSRIFALNLLIKDLTTSQAGSAPLRFAFSTSHHEQLSLDGNLRLNPFGFDGEFKLSDLPLGDYAPYLRPFLTRTPTGTINLNTSLHLRAQQQQLDRFHFILSDLHQPFNAQNDFHLKELQINKLQLSLTDRRVDIAEIVFNQGVLNLSRNAAGDLPLVQLIKAQPITTPSATTEIPHKQSTPWQLHLETLALNNFQSTFIDNAAPMPAPVAVKQFTLKLNNLRWPQADLSDWQFAGDWQSGGTFKAQGQLRHTPLMVKGNFNLQQLDLTPLNSYIPQDIYLKLASAKLDSSLNFTLSQKEKLRGSIKGKLGVRNLSLNGVKDELLHWESLQLDGIQAELEPLSLAISQVSLNNYLARIRVQKDGQINLNQISPETPTREPATNEAPDIAEISAQNVLASQLPFRIDELTLQGGEVSFVDKHLPKIYTTTMHELGGRISGLTTEAGKYASVDLRGSLDNHSPLTISGKIAPFAADLDTSLKIRFTDIDLAPATPYSGTYLGYSIDKGKLYLDLDYRISNRQVKATNKIFLDQFTFGKAVESAEATGLPVRLAVALLKDRKGEIHLDLPVKGNTDDPEFGIFSTVMTLLKNLLVKAATSPFSLLASMFGGGEDFTQISFPAGVATLTAGDLKKLLTLTRMLDERPALKLELSAFIDPENDPEGYRKETLRQTVIKEWQKRSNPVTEQTIPANEYLKNLRRIYKKAKFPKPRNAFGLQKKLPSAEMEKLLLANIRVGEEELTLLAKARATQVQTELIALDPDLKPRIFLKTAEITKTPAKNQQAARVEFGIAAN